MRTNPSGLFEHSIMIKSTLKFRLACLGAVVELVDGMSELK